MDYPLISDYVEAIKAAGDNFDQLKHLRPVLSEDGEPVMSGGNFAVVFKMKDEQTGKLHAVKCFLKEQEGRAEAYRLIAEELEYVSSTFLTPIKYLDKELFVDTNACDQTEFPVLLMDWVEGQTLDKYIREHIDDQYELSLLAYQFSRLAMWLMPQPFAHGDLKPDNILVRNDGTLALVDYDGMYVPAMKGQKARELGSPDFRHPSRTEDDFDEHIDDFSLVSILLSLKAIALQPELLEKYGASERMLFSASNYCNISQCDLLRDLYPSKDSELRILISLFNIALEMSNLSDVSFRLFNLYRPHKKKGLRTLKISKPIVNTRKELIPKFQGKENVIHVICPNGTSSYLSQSRSFDDETKALGGCKLNTIETDKKHVLFLFNDKNAEVGRYYIGKKIQGKSPQELLKIKHSLAFFESWNPETKKWVPCVGVGLLENLTKDNNQRTDVTEEDLANSWVDNYGARYSKDWKRLLKGPSNDVVKSMIVNNQNFNKDEMWVRGPIISKQTGKTSYWCSFDSFESGVLIYLVSEVWKDLSEVNSDTLWDVFSKGDYIIREARDGKTNEWMMDDNQHPIMMIARMKEKAHGSWIFDQNEHYFEELKDVSEFSIRQGTECICDEAFENSVSLKTLSIPDSVKRIGTSPFKNCVSLERISVQFGYRDYYAQLLPNYNHIINDLPF